MSPSDAVRTRLSRLLAESAIEIDALERIASELAHYRDALDSTPDAPVCALVALRLHDYYTAVETLFERIARLVDGDTPSGPDWHRELVTQMSIALPPVRDAVLSNITTGWLHRLRGFRHFLRHAYAVDLDPPHLRAHAGDLIASHPTLRAELDAFTTFVERTRDALPDPEL